MEEILIEVFRTTISSKQIGKKIVETTNDLFPGSKTNIDFDDCDKILRIEGKNFEVHTIVQLVVDSGYHCELLE